MIPVLCIQRWTFSTVIFMLFLSSPGFLFGLAMVFTVVLFIQPDITLFVYYYNFNLRIRLNKTNRLTIRRICCFAFLYLKPFTDIYRSITAFSVFLIQCASPGFYSSSSAVSPVRCWHSRLPDLHGCRSLSISRW